MSSRKDSPKNSMLIRSESNKKIQTLTDKLANHFKFRLSALIAEKSYKYQNMIADIGAFLRKMEKTNLETDVIIPKLEKHLLDIISKMPLVNPNSKYLTDLSKINKLLNNNDVSVSKASLRNSHNVNNSHSKILLTENNLKTLPSESAKILANKPGAYKAVNTLINQNSDFKKNKNLINKPSRQNLEKQNKFNNPNSLAYSSNNITSNINLNNYNKNNISENNNYNNISNLLNQPLSTDRYNTENNLILNRNNNNHLFNNGIYNNNNNLNDYEVFSTNPNNANILNIDEKTPNNEANENGTEAYNLITKHDKLNNLKEKALDEWAMLVKYNHIKHLENEENKKNRQSQKKRLVKEILESQMKEKDNIKKLKQEEDKKFFRLQTEKIDIQEKELLEKEREKFHKLKQQKELQEKLIKGNQGFLEFSLNSYS